MEQTKEVIPLWKHQEEAIRRAGPSFGLFFEPGTGKTRTTIEILRRVYSSHGKLLPTIVFCPLVVVHNWKREILKYSRIKEQDVVVLTGSGAKKLATFEKYKQWPKIFILNYDALVNEELYEALLGHGFPVLICDESHYVKTHNSKRTKKIMQFADRAMFRYILSGTPVLNSPQDIWSQFYILDQGKRFEKKFHYFKIKYFYDKNAGMPSHKHFPDWQIRPGAMAEIEEKISELSMHVKTKDCLSLPPLVQSTIEVELSSEQKRHYEQMKTDFVTYVQDKACVATLAITKALRMQQILTGYMPLDDGSETDFKDNPRLDALKELLQLHTPNHKIIVWACFKQNHRVIEALCKKEGIKYVVLTGEQDGEQKRHSVESFETDERVRVCIANQSVGIGIDLIASSISIYYSRNFNLGHDIQSQARNYRGGSERHDTVYRIDLVAPRTLDEQIMQALQSKKEIGAQLIKDVALNL